MAFGENVGLCWDWQIFWKIALFSQKMRYILYIRSYFYVFVFFIMHFSAPVIYTLCTDIRCYFYVCLFLSCIFQLLSFILGCNLSTSKPNLKWSWWSPCWKPSGGQGGVGSLRFPWGGGRLWTHHSSYTAVWKELLLLTSKEFGSSEEQHSIPSQFRESRHPHQENI